MSTPTREPKKVLFFVAESERFNGAQRSLWQLVVNLDPARIKAVAAFPSKGICYQRFKAANVETVILEPPRALRPYGNDNLALPLWKRLFIILTAILPYSRNIARFMKQRGIEALHCNTTKSMIYAAIWPRLAGIPVVWHVRGELGLFSSSIIRFCCLLSSKIIVVAECLREGIPERYRGKSVTIYNGINQTSLSTAGSEGANELESAIKPQDGRLLIATFAALNPFKGQHHIIEAASLLKRRSNGSCPQFLLIGNLYDKDYTAFLQREIETRKLDNVALLGWKDNPLPYYENSDVVLLSTVQRESLTIGARRYDLRCTEGLPRTVVEAMYLGKIVIATRVAGTLEQIDDGVNGFLISPSSPEGIVRAIEKVMAMPEVERQKMRMAASRKARERFSSKNMVERTSSVLEAL